MQTTTTPEQIDREHDALRCATCDGTGFIELQMQAAGSALEPQFETCMCDECDGGYIDEMACFEHGDYFDPVDQVCGVVRGTGSPQPQLICPVCLDGGETE